MLHAALKTFIAKHDLTLRQLDALVLIATLPREQCTIRGLAAEMGTNKPTITRAADVLNACGWARRTVDPADRRSVFLDITPAGRKAVAPLLALDPASVAKAA